VTTRLTRQGWTVLVGAVLCVVVGRLFAIIELYIMGAALVAAVVLGLFIVLIRRPRVDAHR
jgi:uncharacterized membrane protein YvlD (DUF360 family)